MEQDQFWRPRPASDVLRGSLDHNSDEPNDALSPGMPTETTIPETSNETGSPNNSDNEHSNHHYQTLRERWGQGEELRGLRIVPAAWLGYLKRHKKRVIIIAGGVVTAVALVFLCVMLFRPEDPQQAPSDQESYQSRQANLDRLWRDMSFAAGDHAAPVEACSNSVSCQEELLGLLAVACATKNATSIADAPRGVADEPVREVIQAIMRSMASELLNSDPLWAAFSEHSLERLASALSLVADETNCRLV